MCLVGSSLERAKSGLIGPTRLVYTGTPPDGNQQKSVHGTGMCHPRNWYVPINKLVCATQETGMCHITELSIE